MERYPQRTYDPSWSDREIMYAEGQQSILKLIKLAAEGLELPEV